MKSSTPFSDPGKQHLWVFFGLVIFLSIGLFSCEPSETRSPLTHLSAADSSIFPVDELVIWQKPDGTDDVNAWIRNRIGTNLVISWPCATCDSSLIMVKGQDVKDFIIEEQQQVRTVTPTTNPSKPEGDGQSIYFSMNFYVDIPQYKNENPINQQVRDCESIAFSGDPVKIAVFDTGLRDDFFGRKCYLGALDTTCINRGKFGWNFARSNNNTSDPAGIDHGTMVASLLVQEAEKINDQKPMMIPVKLFDRGIRPKLYDLLCAMSYISKTDVKIINASLGFYPYQYHPYLSLMHEFVNKNLTQNNILLVAAAGNRPDQEDTVTYLVGRTESWRRNIDSNYFYPASLTKDSLLQNIFAVTSTIKSLGPGYSQNQNYSSESVSVGVMGNVDKAVGPDSNYAYFIYPWNSNIHITGSSFAAPILTGKIAAKYNAVIKDGFIRSQMLENLGANISKFEKKEEFTRYVKQGWLDYSRR